MLERAGTLLVAGGVLMLMPEALAESWSLARPIEAK